MNVKTEKLSKPQQGGKITKAILKSVIKKSNATTEDLQVFLKRASS